MRLILDTNVILKALIRDSVVRAILLGSSHEFFVPEHAIDETKKHLRLVAEKSGLSEGETASVLVALLAHVNVIPADKVASKLREAEATISKIDAGDVPFIAAALSVDCAGIWSDDKHLKRQSRIRIWTTKDVAGLGRV